MNLEDKVEYLRLRLMALEEFEVKKDESILNVINEFEDRIKALEGDDCEDDDEDKSNEEESNEEKDDEEDCCSKGEREEIKQDLRRLIKDLTEGKQCTR